MTKGQNNTPAPTGLNKIWLSRTISIVMLLISFLTFWSLALGSFEHTGKPQYLTKATPMPDIGFDHLRPWK